MYYYNAQGDFLRKYYYGTFINELYCFDCFNITLHFEDFTNISLYIYDDEDAKDNGLDLLEMLKSYFYYNNNSYCNFCNRNTRSNFTKRILVCPKILNIVINRVNKNIKDQRQISFKTFKGRINIKEFVHSNYVYNNPEPKNYSLYGTINHYGGVSGGHYVS